MLEMDGWLEGLMEGQGSVALVLVAALALGLRHAADPDHLAAVSTLIASGRRRGLADAARMGIFWGFGHGTTLVMLGFPLLLAGRYLPEAVVRSAELLVGAIIVVLGARLLMRWQCGFFHAHLHGHEGECHRHLHSHSGGQAHDHARRLAIRRPLSSYAVGLVHGVGGSGGLALLLLSTIPGKGQATVALLLFAAGTSLSMAALSTVFGLAIAGRTLGRNFERVAPVLGMGGVAFGLWYALGAVGLATYPL